MIRMRRAGWFLKDIAEAAGTPWTASRVNHLMNKIGVKPDVKPVRFGVRNPIRNDYPRELIYEMYWSCQLSKAEIAYELGIKLKAVDVLFQRLEIPTRTHAQARAISLRRYPHSLVPLTDDARSAGVAKSVESRADRRRRMQRQSEWRARRRAQGLRT
jgi:hypothetical protein